MVMFMSSFIGYVRLGWDTESVDAQQDALRRAGCQQLFFDADTAVYGQRGPGLTKALAAARAGDALVVTRLSCLAQTASDLRAFMIELILAQVELRCLIEPQVELTREDMVLLANVLKVVIDLGQDRHRRARRRGIWEAQKAGAYKGRAPVIDRERVKALHGQGMGAGDIAKALGVARQSVYRILKELAVQSTGP